MNAGRRREDQHLLAYAHGLFVGEAASPLNRWLAGFYSFGLFIWGGGLLFGNGHPAYDNAVFEGLFAFARPEAWGLGFWIAGCLMLMTAITGRAILLLWSLTMTFGIVTGWVVGVLAQTIVSDEAVLTSGAVALYIFTYTGLASMALSPRPLDFQMEIFERDEDGVIVPLRPLDRRAQ